MAQSPQLSEPEKRFDLSWVWCAPIAGKPVTCPPPTRSRALTQHQRCVVAGLGPRREERFRQEPDDGREPQFAKFPVQMMPGTTYTYLSHWPSTSASTPMQKMPAGRLRPVPLPRRQYPCGKPYELPRLNHLPTQHPAWPAAHAVGRSYRLSG